MLKKSKLNLGCRTTDRWQGDEYVNVDITEPCDVIWDLNKVPFPFKDDEFREVRAVDIIEHLSNWEGALGEIVRVTQNQGLVRIKVPYYVWGLGHPNHRRVFSHNTFEILIKNNPRYGCGDFRVVYKHFHGTRLGKLMPEWLRWRMGLMLGEVVSDMEVVLEVQK